MDVKLTPLLISRSQIDDLLWNDHIRRSEQCVVYALTDYLDLVCEDWKALVWPSMNAYTIVMPLPVRRKLGKTVVFQPLFCQHLGIFSRSELTLPDVELFLRTLSSHFSYISAYQFNPENFKLLDRIMWQFPEMEFDRYHTQWLDLGQGYEVIRRGYSKDRKANLRKALNCDWHIISSIDTGPLVRLFFENHVKNIAGGVNPEVGGLLQNIFGLMDRKGNAQLWYAEKDDVIHAGILVLSYASRMLYLFNAADEAGRRGNARTFMLDQYFSKHGGEPTIFDFESPEVSSIASFYRSFGSLSVPFYSINKNGLRFPFRQIQNLRKQFYQNQVISLRRPR